MARPAWSAASVLLLLLTACGGQASTTPNTTAVAARAATVIASLPTAQPLTPRPTRTQAEAPNGTPTPASAAANSPANPPANAPATSLTAASVLTPSGAAMTSAGATDGAALTITASLAASLTATPATTPTANSHASSTQTLTVTALTATAPAAVTTLDYTVQAGDTLMSIALTYKVSMASIMLANDMGDAQVVKLGQVLHVPAAPTWPGDGENVFWFIYIVQPGEALSSIAARFSVKMDDLVRINKLADASAIRIEQKLVIPATNFAPASAPAAALNKPPAPPANPTPRPRADDPQPTAVVAVEQVTQPTPNRAPAVEAPAVAAPAARSAVNPSDSEAFRARILALYNQARNAAGLAALNGTWPLQASAQAHAEDCAQRGYGSHQGSDGSTSRTRIARAGYGGSITGENWAWGRSADEVFDMWFNQEAGGGPHRSNILSPRYAEVGFGIAAANGGFYVIADFGAP